ncbi:MAG: glycosyltransferase family 2 protein [Fuerstiella sp.]
MTLPVTVVIAVRNESANIGRCLQALTNMERVIVVDSHSTDDTPQIAGRLGAEVIQFDYAGGYPKKRQWALDNADIVTPWTLLLDADEVVGPELLAEIGEVVTDADASEGYLISKGFHFLGRRFRYGGFSHAAVLLFRTGTARFEHIMDDNPGGMDMEVHERLVVNGRVGQLRHHLIHEDFKGLQAYLHRHNQYSSWEAAVRHGYFSSGAWGNETIRPKLFGNAQERRRFLKQLVCRLPFEHWIWFLNHYILRLGFLEGRRGLIASRIRAHYIADVHAKLYECRLAERVESPTALPLPRSGKGRAVQPAAGERRAA